MYIIGKKIKVVIDRPLGSVHPNYPTMRYPVNYGYTTEFMAGDDDFQDAYVLGIKEPLNEFEGEVVGVVHRLNDNEDKWVVATSDFIVSKEEIFKNVQFQEKYFDVEIEI